MATRLKQRLRTLGVALAMLAPLAGHAAEPAYVVGQAIDLSGPNGSIGRDYVAGITTYFDAINTKGGINGRKIAYIVRDDHGVPAESAKLASDLIKLDHADYLLGGIGVAATQAIVAAPAFAASNHVLFAPLADSLSTSRARVLFWRPSIEHEFQFILAYFGNLGIKNVGIAYQETPSNQASYQFVVAELKKRGMTLSGVAKLSGTPKERDEQALALSKTGTQLVLAISDTIASGLFLKEFRKHAPAVFVAGTSLINLDTLSEVAGSKGTAWTVFSQVVPNPSAGASALQLEHIDMMKKFRDESLSSVTLEGFAVGKTLVKAIRMDGPGHVDLQSFIAHKSAIDLGGMTVSPAGKDNNLSAYVAIALFKQGGGLMF